MPRTGTEGLFLKFGVLNFPSFFLLTYVFAYEFHMVLNLKKQSLFHRHPAHSIYKYHEDLTFTLEKHEY